jgi:hypothetical protein
MEKDVAIRQLMQACEKDPELFAKLVDKPEEVAKEFKVTLGPDEIAQLQRVKQLQNLVNEFKVGRGGLPHPSGYPIDVMWKNTLANHILFYRPIYYPIFYPIYYPVFYRWHFPVTGYPAGPIETQGGQFTGLRSARKRR